MATPVKDYSRTIDETYPIARRCTISQDRLLALGYASLDAAATALAAATVEWIVPLATPAITVACDVDVTQQADGVELVITMAPPTTMTDVVQAHDYYVILERNSPTSELRLWRGRWTVSAAPEVV